MNGNAATFRSFSFLTALICLVASVNLLLAINSLLRVNTLVLNALPRQYY